MTNYRKCDKKSVFEMLRALSSSNGDQSNSV